MLVHPYKQIELFSLVICLIFINIVMIKIAKNIIQTCFSTLARKSAENRSNFIKKNTIDYTYYLSLHFGNDYDGLSNISFETHHATLNEEYLKIDFQAKKINGLMINSQVIPQPLDFYRDGSIHIPKNKIMLGQRNNVAIHYSNNYDKDGNGCVSYIDQHGKQYLYTQFQPYFANTVFPLFDQPDLKAPMNLTIFCPDNWETVLSNEFMIDNPTRNITVSSIAQNVILKYQTSFSSFIKKYQESIPSNYKVTAFNRTQLLPSYLYCFVVGAYKELVINKKMQGKPGYVPMKLYSIQQLYPQLQKLTPYIEQITIKSMQYFQKYFGYNYPFSKYDQVFAHEYKWGAMQNAGIVTLNDLYLFKDKVSNQKLLSFGNTIVHQLCHHWFGNLVTMKWWDDLWLNQSFAEYISHFCLEKIKKDLTTISFQSGISFYNRKAWGYTEDELVTTHPIRGEVEDTFTAESIFDGITYSKGAATMKQLMYLIGQQSFSDALKSYFHKYQFSNAVLDDLLASLQPHFHKSGLNFNLAQWKTMWLQTAGTNILRCQWTPGSNKAVIIQSADRIECPTLRLHRIKIALIQSDHSIISKQVLVLPQERTEITIEIFKQTVAILLNYQDLTFAKIQLDQVSRKYFYKNLTKVDDVLSRALVWSSYFNMLKVCKITSKDFIEFVVSNLSTEPSDPIFEQEIAHLYSAIQLYTPKEHQENLYHRVYSFLKELLLKQSVSHENRKVILRDKLIDFARSHVNRKEMRQWYHGTSSELSKQPLTNTLRWKLVLNTFSDVTLQTEIKWVLFEDMKLRDPSQISKVKKYTCQALVANDTQLQKMYRSYFNQKNDLSLTNCAHQMRGFNHEIHGDIIKDKYYQRYFRDAQRYLSQEVNEQQKWMLKGDYVQNFVVNMDPIIDATEVDIQNKINNFRNIKAKNNNKIQRIILKKIDMLERRKKVCNYYISKQGAHTKIL